MGQLTLLQHTHTFDSRLTAQIVKGSMKAGKRTAAGQESFAMFTSSPGWQCEVLRRCMTPVAFYICWMGKLPLVGALKQKIAYC